MCMMCDMMAAGATEEEAKSAFFAKIARDVEQMGWSGVAVGGDEETRPFSYTVGLSGQDRPDIVVVGLPGVTGHTLVHELLNLDQPLVAGMEYLGVARGFPIKLVEPLPGVAEEMTQSQHYHEIYHPDKEWKALQLLWPDPDKRFPGHPLFDPTMEQTITIQQETLQ